MNTSDISKFLLFFLELISGVLIIGVNRTFGFWLFGKYRGR